MTGDILRLGSDDVLSFIIGSRRVNVRCRMPQGGDKPIWGIQVDGTWYGMNLEGQASETRQTIEKAAANWLKYDFPNLPKS